MGRVDREVSKERARRCRCVKKYQKNKRKTVVQTEVSEEISVKSSADRSIKKGSKMALQMKVSKERAVKWHCGRKSKRR